MTSFYLVGITSYGIFSSMQVFQKGSPIARDFSEAILRLSEAGILKELEEKWLTPRECLTETSTNTEPLSFQNFWGLYLISGVTSAICFLLALIRLIKKYKHNQKADQGSATPNPTSFWNKAVGLAKYYYNGEISTALERAPSLSHTPDLEDHWSSSRWEELSTSDIPNNIIQASPPAEIELSSS